MKRNAQLGPNEAGKRPIVVYGALFNAARFLEIPAAELENITGLSQPTLFRLKKSLADGADRDVNPKSYESILLFLRMFRSLDSIFGGNAAHCKEWINSSNKAIGGKPIEFIRTSEGLVQVVSYLDAMRAKI